MAIQVQEYICPDYQFTLWNYAKVLQIEIIRASRNGTPFLIHYNKDQQKVYI